MLGYLVKRLAAAIPVLVVVSIAAFFLASSAPGDVVEAFGAATEQLDYQAQRTSYSERRASYGRIAAELQRDKPLFYFSILPGNMPDTCHHIVHQAERKAFKSLIRQGVDAHTLSESRSATLAFIQLLEDDTSGVRFATRLANECEFLLLAQTADQREQVLQNMQQMAQRNRQYMSEVAGLTELSTRIEQERRIQLSDILPVMRWYGLENQYHHWLRGIMRFDFGVSIADGRSAATRISESIGWTLRLNIVTILLAFGISIPLGVALARRSGTLFERITNTTLFAFFAIPSFWLATLFIVFLTTQEYHPALDLFPGSGVPLIVGDDKAGWLLLAIHLFLPVLSLLLGTLAYLTQQMQQAVADEAGKDYVRMAYAKGLSERKVYRHHILRNALFPIITILGAAIPASISGSVVIEVIFGIPGMGRLLYTSILAQDWNVVFAMVLLGTLLTLVGYALSDILYRLFDPRLKRSQT